MLCWGSLDRGSCPGVSAGSPVTGGGQAGGGARATPAATGLPTATGLGSCSQEFTGNILQ
ncbi:MAG: hypothetical protein MUC60_14045 [Oscillatoria sp. Prado101]|nr:hypothetical protein [Oscillatoria sp. Prado101]